MQVNENSVPVRLSLLELQTARIVSDIESEKGTRARTTHDLYARLDAMKDEFRAAQERTNRILYMMMGGLVVLQVGLQFFKG